MDLTTYIKDPSQLSQETLHQLRELVARYPYFPAARLLYLQNLFLLHDPMFGEELRRSALLLPDRKPLFEMVEGANYAIDKSASLIPEELRQKFPAEGEDGRTESLIDSFLNEQSPNHSQPAQSNAMMDYTSYLMQLDDVEDESNTEQKENLLDEYISNADKHIELKDEPEYAPELPEDESEDDDVGDDFLTETLARIYIKQGRYEKAAEIMRRINFNYPKKNIYFADQIRFLEKLIVNERNKKSKQ